jgi:hypothetical protein
MALDHLCLIWRQFSGVIFPSSHSALSHSLSIRRTIRVLHLHRLNLYVGCVLCVKKMKCLYGVRLSGFIQNIMVSV